MKMDKAQKQAALNTALIIGWITVVVVGLRVLIEFFGIQVCAIIAISFLVGMLVKMMYENEVDKIRTLDKLNNRSTDTGIK
jgi:hypothetical protein